MPAGETRRIAIEPVTRVEGHGKVTLLLDEAGRVSQARFHVVEFRGFERFIQGRPYWELPVAVERLCGICPVSHHLCAAKAVDQIAGVTRLTPTAEKLRRLMHYGQTLQSHALHFFYLAAPDLLFGFESDPLRRNVLGVAAQHPELARQGILMRRYGQEIIRLTAGRRVHGTGAIPGGVNKGLCRAERDELLRELPQQREWAKKSVALARDYTLEHLELLGRFAAFASNHVALVRQDGALDLYDGGLRAVDAQGRKLFDHVDPRGYLDHLAEEVRPWSYMKFPFLKALGPEQGFYRVGPLARVSACDFIPTPLAEAARREFVAAAGGRPSELSMAYHWARMIELLHCVETIDELLNDAELLGDDLQAEAGPRRLEGIAAIEAPRGTLFHHYRVGEDDLVTMANLIVSTTSNNEPINRAVASVAREFLDGHEITEGLLNHIEVAIRAYDPCLSCATHAIGQMPLRVDLLDPDGVVVATRTKEAQA